MSAISSESFKAAMRHLASSVCIVTTQCDDIRSGLVATAVCSVSADPPMLLVCINRQAKSHSAFVTAGHFCVNVLGAGQTELADRFAKSSADARFNGLSCDRLTTGAPALTDALITFDCETTHTATGGTHTVFFGRIVDLRYRSSTTPLLYYDGRYADVVPQNNPDTDQPIQIAHRPSRHI